MHCKAFIKEVSASLQEKIESLEQKKKSGVFLQNPLYSDALLPFSGEGSVQALEERLDQVTLLEFQCFAEENFSSFPIWQRWKSIREQKQKDSSISSSALVNQTREVLQGGDDFTNPDFTNRDFSWIFLSPAMVRISSNAKCSHYFAIPLPVNEETDFSTAKHIQAHLENLSSHMHQTLTNLGKGLDHPMRQALNTAFIEGDPVLFLWVAQEIAYEKYLQAMESLQAGEEAKAEWQELKALQDQIANFDVEHKMQIVSRKIKNSPYIQKFISITPFSYGAI
jgi:cell fate (sporulation/competence/biofilm development) regulator YmcA (YheA/YmcA/DUF963 family)